MGVGRNHGLAIKTKRFWKVNMIMSMIIVLGKMDVDPVLDVTGFACSSSPCRFSTIRIGLLVVFWFILSFVTLATRFWGLAQSTSGYLGLGGDSKSLQSQGSGGTQSGCFCCEDRACFPRAALQCQGPTSSQTEIRQHSKSPCNRLRRQTP